MQRKRSNKNKAKGDKQASDKPPDVGVGPSQILEGEDVDEGDRNSRGATSLQHQENDDTDINKIADQLGQIDTSETGSEAPAPPLTPHVESRASLSPPAPLAPRLSTIQEGLEPSSSPLTELEPTPVSRTEAQSSGSDGDVPLTKGKSLADPIVPFSAESDEEMLIDPISNFSTEDFLKVMEDIQSDPDHSSPGVAGPSSHKCTSSSY